MQSDYSVCAFENNLHADGQVDPGAEGGANSAWRQAKIFEEFGEGLREREARTFLCYHHTASHTRQIQTPSLEGHTWLKVIRQLPVDQATHNSAFVDIYIQHLPNTTKLDGNADTITNHKNQMVWSIWSLSSINALE